VQSAMGACGWQGTAPVLSGQWSGWVFSDMVDRWIGRSWPGEGRVDELAGIECSAVQRR
jgi:hypothetical protein